MSETRKVHPAWMVAVALLGAAAVAVAGFAFISRDAALLRGPPAIARDLRTFDGPEITQRLTALFPKGSDASRLSAYLTSQHFAVDDEARRADYAWSTPKCDLGVDVAWRADARGKLEEITGAFRKRACR